MCHCWMLKKRPRVTLSISCDQTISPAPRGTSHQECITSPSESSPTAAAARYHDCQVPRNRIENESGASQRSFIFWCVVFLFPPPQCRPVGVLFCTQCLILSRKPCGALEVLVMEEMGSSLYLLKAQSVLYHCQHHPSFNLVYKVFLAAGMPL
mgnify:CR=1 FL=1